MKEYYESHKDSFTVTIKRDSTKGDSTYIRPLDDVKNRISDSLFLRDNKPDSAFLSRYDSLPAQEDLDAQWLQYIHKNVPAFFMKKIYSEVTGSPFPDSTSELFGEGKIITQEDMDVIMGWIPEARHSYYSTPERKRELVEWLLKWKLFTDKAAESGFIERPIVKDVLEWAWKLNVVYAYINEVLAPEVKSSVTIDTGMLMYSLFDDNGYKPVKKESSLFDNKVKREIQDAASRKIDSIIIAMRREISVTFHQNDWKDNLNEDPSALLEEANTLRDSGKTAEAKRKYQSLSKDFPLSEEGQTSLIELAKLQTEQQQYSQAIKNYRNFLLLSGDKSRRCNTFFMIGFIYDEYLDKPRHAEANYKWVLRNTPGCELADDAEFMMLHLNEPMTSVEELRAEADRQGRKVEDDEVQEESIENAPTDSATSETTS
jgi:tetratricopeptide (TPR) repeat protein